MAMDETDKRLVNGMMWIAGVCVAAYFLPWIGYQTQVTEEELARTDLIETSKQYRKYYPDMHPAVQGRPSAEASEDLPGIPMDELKVAYVKSNKELDENIDKKEVESRMSFPDWTNIPPDYSRQPGEYFVDQLNKKEREIDNEVHSKTVYLDDPEIGFTPFKGRTRMTELEAIEYLRELYIAEEIIRLCVQAKANEETAERNRGVKPEAYMRIIEISPEQSVTQGPTVLELNPAFSEAAHQHNPLLRKFNIHSWPKFIQEYPVHLMLQCDSNTFQRFLYSVRQTGHHFLVIRNLEIVSPYIAESNEDKSELKGQEGQETKLGGDKPNAKLDNGHIQVTISAAGMDFFDPSKNPNGLCAPASDATKVAVKPHHIIPPAPTAQP